MLHQPHRHQHVPDACLRSRLRFTQPALSLSNGLNDNLVEIGTVWNANVFLRVISDLSLSSNSNRSVLLKVYFFTFFFFKGFTIFLAIYSHVPSGLQTVPSMISNLVSAFSFLHSPKDFCKMSRKDLGS